MKDQELLQILRAVADESRLKILRTLEKRELCNCEITDVFSLRQSTVSHHLKILAEAHLITVRKEGKWNYYQLNHSTLEQLGPSLLQYVSAQIEEKPLCTREC
ncbi:ArsR/SmtB family transcription factor [Heliorestis convoluta]|uniref:Transcriptional regulator, ArsR family n=1 Tax=Heliorestis convoluta TaxID=356322 RepID=A0A5Q2MY09_9FIRM|nr:metalloregulator ArsR/SmtB family transcription factor [Heliorestis convoluta]QGG46781.1 Transcriptional regulator, ArsR family [Heliorestis convoluta]